MTECSPSGKLHTIGIETMQCCVNTTSKHTGLTARTVSDAWPRRRVPAGLALSRRAPPFRHLHGLEVVQVGEDPVNCPLQNITLAGKRERARERGLRFLGVSVGHMLLQMVELGV